MPVKGIGRITAAMDNSFCYAELGSKMVKVEVECEYGKAPVLVLTCAHGDLVVQNMMGKDELRITVKAKP